MENDLFMSMMPSWKYQHTLMEINSSSSSDQSPANSLFIPFWDKSPENPLFDSITSSPVSRPPSVKSPTDEGFLIRELIGKFENSPKLGNFNMGLNPRTLKFSGDPNSGYGSKSFNGRTSWFGLNHGDEFLNGMAEQSYAGKRVSRVASIPSLNASSPPMADQGNKTLQSEEMASCLEGSSVSNPEKVNLKKRKSSLRGKEVEDEANSKMAKQSKNGSVKVEENGGCSSDNAEEEKKTPEPLQDYIHVRARRGQATDSHSLAERVRREKIGERMKMLQDIVPGCNKVTGKALMLDEIINYVQSLQSQVEFLSMKLASVDSSSSMVFNAEAPVQKDVLFRSEDTAHPMFPQDSSVFYSQKNLPLNSSTGSLPHCAVDSQHLLPLALDGLNQHILSYENFCGDDLHLQNIVNHLGFVQTALNPLTFRGE